MIYRGHVALLIVKFILIRLHRIWQFFDNVECHNDDQWNT